MPNIKSAKKRVLVNQTKAMQNKMFNALAQETYKAAVKKIDQAAARGIIHKNAAARKKSQFTKALNNM